MSEIPDVAGGETITSAFTNNVKNRTVMRYANEAARDASIPVPVEGDLAYWRFGGKEGQEGLNYEDLGFVDPSGGPFIEVGMEINGKTIKRIAAVDMPDGDKVAVFLEVD